MFQTIGSEVLTPDDGNADPGGAQKGPQDRASWVKIDEDQQKNRVKIVEDADML